jgi:methionyl aminopeptidase
MMTRVKTAKELADQRISGQMNATILGVVAKAITAGITTKDLANIASDELKKLGGKPTFLGYGGFPDVICISVNNEVVHGIPTTYILKDGDVISFDFGVTYNGMITDAARSVIVGDKSTAQTKKLVQGTLRSLDAGISVLKGGVRVGTIAAAIEKEMTKHGFGIVRDLVGHGVGHQLHEDPNIPNYGNANTGPILHSGMTIAIEPMATLGSDAVYTAADGWTILTKDGSLAAHFEDTILVTDDGAEILTRL